MEELPPMLVLTLGGVLGAVANVALGDKTIVLPRLRGNRLHLGFVAQLIACIGVAHVVDHDFQTAFFSSLCGMALLRHLKRRIEGAFQEGVAITDERGD